MSWKEQAASSKYTPRALNAATCTGLDISVRMSPTTETRTTKTRTTKARTTKARTRNCGPIAAVPKIYAIICGQTTKHQTQSRIHLCAEQRHPSTNLPPSSSQPTFNPFLIVVVPLLRLLVHNPQWPFLNHQRLCACEQRLSMTCQRGEQIVVVSMFMS